MEVREAEEMNNTYWEEVRDNDEAICSRFMTNFIS